MREVGRTTRATLMTEHRKPYVHRLDSSEPVILWQQVGLEVRSSSVAARWSMTVNGTASSNVSACFQLDAHSTLGQQVEHPLLYFLITALQR
jgi:hypothetical protein